MISALSNRFLNWAAEHENAFVALYFTWVAFAWTAFFAGLAFAIYGVWVAIDTILPAAPTMRSDNAAYYQATIRRGLDTYTMCHAIHWVKGKRVVHFFWVRLPRPGKR